jgi:hypothetical protein
MRQELRLYVLFVAALGAAALAQSLRTVSFDRVDPLMLAILIGLAAAAQRMPVFLFRSSAISISFAAVIASYVLYGTEIAVIVSLFQAGVNAVTPRRKPLQKALFNAGSLATSSRSPRCGCATSMALGPSRARRRAASAADRPSAVAAVAARSRSWGNDQNASVPDVGVACAEGLMLPAS